MTALTSGSFELMPLYLKRRVIDEGVVVYARDVRELYEYFYPFRRIWSDQKHRQSLSRDEMRDARAGLLRKTFPSFVEADPPSCRIPAVRFTD